MPIKGLSENRRMVRLGKIRLGIKVEGGRSPYPQAVDYFVCPPPVQAVFGERPTTLRVAFPTDNPEQWSSQYYRRYSASRGLVCKGDGEQAMALIDAATGAMAIATSKKVELREWLCTGKDCEFYQNKSCRPIMNLQFLLPEVEGIGIWQIDTSSVNSIIKVNSAVELIRSLTGGHIAMLPMELMLVEQDAAPEGQKKTIHVLDVHAPYTIERLRGLAALPTGEALLLPAPDDEVPDDLFPTEVIEAAEAKAKPPAPATVRPVRRPPNDAAPAKPIGDDQAGGIETPAERRIRLNQMLAPSLGTLYGNAYREFTLTKSGVLTIINKHQEEIVDTQAEWAVVVASQVKDDEV